METEILKKIDEIEEQMIDAIKSIVRIDSVKSEAQPGMPFGKGVNDALEATLKLCEELGFETENVDGRMGIAKYGQGEDYIGIIGHLDVVPVGDGWKYEPFGAEEVNGRIFGRGILDNKGPVLSCLFGLYVLKELNIKLKHPVWILFGTDEESGFEDLEYYLTKKKPPIMGWTPDCKYPVVYAERGRAAIRVYADIKHQKEFNHFVNEYLLTSDDHANKLGLNIVDEEFGAMQLRGKSLIDCDEDLGFEFVLSYPASITIEEIMDKVKSKLSENLKAECAKNYDPVRFEKTGFLCSSLQKAYEKITGFDGTPVTTTGGTYAKLMPNIVPFGPSFPGQKGIGHNPDEWMDRKDLMTNAKIYALSLLYLGSGE